MSDASTIAAPDAIALPAALNIETVDAFATLLREVVPAAPAMILDASSTEVLTTPGIQLLLALEKTLASAGIGLVIHQPKPSFAQAFEQLGLGAHFLAWGA